ncbi:MAG TPA: glycogen/starch/alpha-glucan phosphorylase [Blastocatellia bacterium]|nr:glycogen/starch/alpha-glucan phosphorylase [Blastocatellia bacterium]
MDARSLKWSFQDHIEFSLAKDRYTVTEFDHFTAAALTVRDRLIERWLSTQDTYLETDPKRVYYLSMEFLMGRTLGNSLVNLGLYDELRRALEDLDFDLETLREIEWDAGLGNGGLGRLAACFLDSLATLGLPGYGYGIRYEYGIFHQRIKRGYQVEQPDNWLRYGNAWELPRTHSLYPVHYYGRVLQFTDRNGHLVSEWLDTTEVLAMAYDTPIPGYGTNTVNTLRLWSAKATREFDFNEFNEGDYVQAVRTKSETETISKVLYPNDNRFSGKELRLKQEYFFVAASLQDIIHRYKRSHESFDEFADKIAIQLNDTHPAIAVAELMRLLVDVEGVEWDQAWDITVACFGYTNHTVMPEALERWSVELLGKVLPRHLLIIYEINHRFMKRVRANYPGDDARCSRMSIVDEGGPHVERSIRMAHLAIVGSHSVNGVSSLHSDILKKDLFRDFAEMFPERFNNKTNGITQRRWLRLCNPELSDLITERIGDGWVGDLNQLEKLGAHTGDDEFLKQWRGAKRAMKKQLAGIIKREAGVSVDPDMLFDVQIKRIHDYKRQLMNALHVIALYNDIRDNPRMEFVPRAVIFGGKAAPGYARAKLTIKLINSIADVVNRDPHVRGVLKVAFIPNYNVSLAEKIIPGADLSEQISLAGTEASGTGNMKFALNGALTIGTLDGANIELRERVGDENIFIFGMKADEVEALKPRYVPRVFYEQNPALKRTIDMIASGYFSPLERDLFKPIVNFLLEEGDPYMVLADFGAYAEMHKRVRAVYQDPDEWTRRAIRNVASMGWFSSDRTIHEYAEEIWHAKPVNVEITSRDR